ncbi:hypothetical protein TIFTF001_006645 [Ficus carica]|uniref:non-specific serine/threonine protein kinase n=1 Tax=Ficus carica TaxID=3494 RepID=A0AA87ZJD6_FICCA|nr:hypothetical protein TIFTF001_006645 [Ficus carica]
MHPIPSRPAGFTSIFPRPLARNSSSSSEKRPPPPQSPGIALGLSQSAFTYEELAEATENFSPAKLVGRGRWFWLCPQRGASKWENGCKHLVSLVGDCISGAWRILILNNTEITSAVLLLYPLDKGNFNDVVDSRLQFDYNYSEVTRMVARAAACVHHSARLRPRMSQRLDEFFIWESFVVCHC